MKLTGKELEAQLEKWNARRFAQAKEIVDGIEGASIGYIGNLERWGDDRSWSIFLAHPGRVGQTFDRLGAFPTEERGKLLPFALALNIGNELGKLGIEGASAERQARNRHSA